MFAVKLLLQADLKIKKNPIIVDLRKQPIIGTYLKAGLPVIAILAITAGFFLFQDNTKIAQADWWNDNWSYRKAIVINSDYVTGDLTDFPALISVDPFIGNFVGPIFSTYSSKRNRLWKFAITRRM